MPRGDRTGPIGNGPMTGRGAGYCAGFSVPGYASSCGWGVRCGSGRGRRFRRIFYDTGLPRWAYFRPQYADERFFTEETDEKEFLKKQAEFLENQLDEVKKRLEELED
jgi:hypothetical protein